jgi:hypothetical protein
MRFSYDTKAEKLCLGKVTKTYVPEKQIPLMGPSYIID